MRSVDTTKKNNKSFQDAPWFHLPTKQGSELFSRVPLPPGHWQPWQNFLPYNHLFLITSSSRLSKAAIEIWPHLPFPCCCTFNLCTATGFCTEKAPGSTSMSCGCNTLWVSLRNWDQAAVVPWMDKMFSFLRVWCIL